MDPESAHHQGGWCAANHAVAFCVGTDRTLDRAAVEGHCTGADSDPVAVRFTGLHRKPKPYEGIGTFRSSPTTGFGLPPRHRGLA